LLLLSLCGSLPSSEGSRLLFAVSIPVSRIRGALLRFDYVNILIVVLHTLYRRGLGLLLSTLFTPITIIEAGDVQTALNRMGDVACKLVIVDMDAPGMGNLAGLEKLRKRAPEIPIVILSSVTDISTIRYAMDLGARGYLLKSSTEAVLKYALSMALAGKTYVPFYRPHHNGKDAIATGGEQQFSTDNPLSALTERQLDVLKMVVKGLPDAEIARRLRLLESTVKTHVKIVRAKLGAANRTQAAVIGAELGLSRIT
jgi:two-component system, NarL family, nitrate/nitrite response regulator NarL